ncbi:MAG TPA: spermidine/putrescine ABC transporter substrate-binding protein [Gaiellaceae bacterium]|jgi:spermidine/putrescine transport system substrate-binding protein|nr:spermidine/putrescine ABC transporter substrate-binding protein [Gaiellaceae bacterium]
MSETFTRIQLLRRGAAAGVVLTIPSSFLAACGGDGEEAAATTEAAKKQLAKTLRFSNWTLYIDIDEKTKKRPTLEQFEQKTGTKVAYFEDINDNASYFGKIQRPLSQGQSIDRDIVVLTDNSRFPALLVKKGWAEKLDKSAIPNMSKLQDALAHPSFDPNRDYSLPWQSGMTGIATNLKLTGGKAVTTMDQLLEDRKLKGKVTLLTEMADTMSLVMLANGDDPTKVDDTSFQKALDRIKKAVDSGQVRQFTGNDYSGPLSKGDLAAAMSWSGDVVQLTVDNKNLVWNLPESGGDIWTDNMLIPKGGDVFTASTFMNFVYDPKIAAQIAAYVNYITPVKGAKEEAAKLDPKLATNPLIFPDEATLSKVKIFDSEALSNQDYAQKWQTLIGS